MMLQLCLVIVNRQCEGKSKALDLGLTIVYSCPCWYQAALLLISRFIGNKQQAEKRGR